MQLDKTWTITFDDDEQERFKLEASSLDLPTDLGRPLVLRIIGAPQVTLPLRGIERALVELDIARANFLARQHSILDYRRQYPVIEAFYQELNKIVNAPHRRSA